MSSNRGHRAGQCAPEVLRTRIRARGDLQERRTRPNYSHIQHLTPSPRPGSSLIRPRCARLLAKPEYSSPPNEVCCWQGAPWQLRCCWSGHRGAAEQDGAGREAARLHREDVAGSEAAQQHREAAAAAQKPLQQHREAAGSEGAKQHREALA